MLLAAKVLCRNNNLVFKKQRLIPFDAKRLMCYNASLMKKILFAVAAIIFVSNCVKADDPDVVFLTGVYNDLKTEFPAINPEVDREGFEAREKKIRRLEDKFISSVFSHPNREDFTSRLIQKKNGVATDLGNLRDSRATLKEYFAKHYINFSLTEKVTGESFSKEANVLRQYKSHSDYSRSTIKLYRPSSVKGASPIPVAEVEVWYVYSVFDSMRPEIDEVSHQEGPSRYVGDVTLFE